jgi:2-keto-4-pentenoate hydratase
VDFYTHGPKPQIFVRLQLKMTPVSFIQQLTANLEWAEGGECRGKQDQSMGGPDEPKGETERADAIARQFVQARRAGTAIGDFPGAIPSTLDYAYRIQDAAIRRWPDSIIGWKVGYIAPELREPAGDERLVGPIFAGQLQLAEPGVSLDFPVFASGFAAVEAELVFRLGADAPADKIHWTLDEAAALAADLHIGIETAGSPLATINELGPRVVVSDFGNNAGMLLGPKIPDWRATRVLSLECASFVDDREVGVGSVETLAGGPLAALAFALSRCGRNDRPLRAGQLVTTGAVTGIHDIVAGQSARVDFGAYGSLCCRAVDAREFARARGLPA